MSVRQRCGHAHVLGVCAQRTYTKLFLTLPPICQFFPCKVLFRQLVMHRHRLVSPIPSGFPAENNHGRWNQKLCGDISRGAANAVLRVASSL
jgi:hypothetical protein